MSFQVISVDELKAKRRAATLVEQVPYVFAGEMRSMEKRIENGRMQVFELAKPIGELIQTPAGLEALIQNSVIQLEVGREEVPLLYKPIYRSIEDSNFTRNVDIAPFVRAQCVFLEHMEMEEVKFGTKWAGPRDTVPIVTFASGFQITEDMRLYDTTWEIAEMNRSMGEAYNALLNNLHLLPIIAAVYPAANITGAVVNPAMPRTVNIRQTLRQGLIDSYADVNAVTGRRRYPNILLAQHADRFDIEEALQKMHINATEYPGLKGIDTIIYYDGWTGNVGERTYNYLGVPALTCYLIEGQRYFRELIKHDLRIDADNADLSRLIEEQIVARCRRGVISYPLLSVQQVTLPV
jgi:hypothetical protein